MASKMEKATKKIWSKQIKARATIMKEWCKLNYKLLSILLVKTQQKFCANYSLKEEARRLF